MKFFPSDIVDNCTILYIFLFPEFKAASILEPTWSLLIPDRLSKRSHHHLLSAFHKLCLALYLSFKIYSFQAHCEDEDREGSVLHPDPVFCCRLICPWFFHVLHKDL